MKTVLILLFIASIALPAFSQKLEASKIPPTVKEGFKKAHPGSVALWEKEGVNYEANFKENGKIMSCVVDKNGTILETESAITIAELPAAAKTYVHQHYAGKKWKEIAKIVKSSGEVNYEVNVNGTDILFDANGNHLQKLKE